MMQEVGSLDTIPTSLFPFLPKNDTSSVQQKLFVLDIDIVFILGCIIASMIKVFESVTFHPNSVGFASFSIRFSLRKVVLNAWFKIFPNILIIAISIHKKSPVAHWVVFILLVCVNQLGETGRKVFAKIRRYKYAQFLCCVETVFWLGFNVYILVPIIIYNDQDTLMERQYLIMRSIQSGLLFSAIDITSQRSEIWGRRFDARRSYNKLKVVNSFMDFIFVLMYLDAVGFKSKGPDGFDLYFGISLTNSLFSFGYFLGIGEHFKHRQTDDPLRYLRIPKDWKDFIEFNQNSCPICLESDPKLSNGLVETHCHHVFHHDCLKKSTTTTRKCPMCNLDMNYLFNKVK